MYYEDIQTGDRRILPEVRVEREKMLDFSRQYNGALCHVSDEFAARTRAGAITAQGIYTFALLWGQYAPNNFGQAQDIGGSDLNMEFFRPVFAGDVLHGLAYVESKTDRNPYNGAIRVVMEVYNQRDELVLRSRSSSVILKREHP
ncbi:MAG: hypothetical protein IJU29_08760 [Oscillospiraceae bacterium]|nr:hypothetical protein [Oscillospiraceae bacterium]